MIFFWQEQRRSIDNIHPKIKNFIYASKDIRFWIYTVPNVKVIDGIITPNDVKVGKIP